MAGASAWRRLHAGAITVGDYRCACGARERSPTEASRTHSFAIVRAGSFLKHAGALATTADANAFVFFNAHEEYRVSHPAGCGDRCTTFEVSPDALAEALASVGAAEGDAAVSRGRPFTSHAAPCGPAAFAAHRDLVDGLARGDAASLAVEESAAALLAQALASAQGRGTVGRRRNSGSDEADRTRVEAARALLAARMRERVALAEVAAAARCSVFHLARIFRAATGVPMHRYQTRLRIRDAMESITDPRTDLARLAGALGFVDQSHLTAAFSRETGITPGAWRTRALGAGPRAARKVSKNFQAAPAGPD